MTTADLKPKYNMKKSAGVVIIYKNKMLVCHPTGWQWKNSYSIPKGGIEEGESILDAALRECREEVGILLKPSQLGNKMYQIEYQSSNKKKGIYKTVYYWLCNINDLSEIGLKSEVLPKNQLQKEEVDWAGFLDYKEANYRLSPVMKILTKHLDMNANEGKNFKVKSISEFISESYATYTDVLKTAKKLDLDTLKDKLKNDIKLATKHLLPYDWEKSEEMIDSIEDMSDDQKGIKFEVKLKDGNIVHFFYTNSRFDSWEIYFNKKKMASSDIRSLLRSQLPGLDQYILSLKGHDWFYQYADDNRAYKSGTASAERMVKLYSELSNSDKKKAYNEFLKVAPKERQNVEFKMFNGI
jgi:8-oxo-dGTP pyrophosphatase MutT (NUDIX family)